MQIPSFPPIKSYRYRHSASRHEGEKKRKEKNQTQTKKTNHNTKITTNIDFCLVYQLPGIQNWMSPHLLHWWHIPTAHHPVSWGQRNISHSATDNTLNDQPVSDPAFAWQYLILHLLQPGTQCSAQGGDQGCREPRFLTWCYLYQEIIITGL